MRISGPIPQLLLMLAVVFTGTTLYAQTTSSAASAIRKADLAWEKVFAAKDLDKSVDFCAADASVLSPNAPIATGHDAISKLFAGFFALPDLKISWRPDKVEAARSGDLGYSRGAYEMTFKGPDGKQMSDKGKYVTVWKKQADGSWKVVNDIFNSDMPEAGSAPQK